MSVVSVTETHEGREGDLTADTASLRRVFLVRTDNVRDGALTVRDAAGIPALYSTYFDGTTSDARYIAKRKSATNHDSSQKLWKVEVEYETLDSDTGSQPELAPQLRQPEYTWSTGNASEQMVEDIAGQRVHNSVKQPFEPPVERDNSFRILTIVRNELSFDAYAMDAYINTLNQTPIFGYGSREGKMYSIDALLEYDANYGAYWRVTYVIHFRRTSQWAPIIASGQRLRVATNGVVELGGGAPGPWDTTRRNVGTRYFKSDSEAVKYAAVGANGIAEGDPIDLAVNGTKLPEANPATDPFWLIFYPYNTIAWFPLQLES